MGRDGSSWIMKTMENSMNLTSHTWINEALTWNCSNPLSDESSPVKVLPDRAAAQSALPEPDLVGHRFVH